LQLFIFPISLFLTSEIKTTLNGDRISRNILRLMFLLILSTMLMNCLSISAFNLCIVAEMYVPIILYKFLNLAKMLSAQDMRHSRVKPAIILYASMMFNLRIGEVLLVGKGPIFTTRGHDIHNQNHHTAIVGITCKSDVSRMLL
jgi:hypothetical protein